MTLVALLSISLVLFSFSIKTTNLTHAHCLSDQRDALIQLRQGFNTTKLHSWNASTDCCIWDGIKCDEQTGMVTALNLTDRSISGEINPALFKLSYLRYLNLANNQFNNIILPQTGFKRHVNLTHLLLSNSGFVGEVPISISALTNLISLDLSYNYAMNFHDTSLKTLLSNLTKLQVLYLDGVDISLNGSEWISAVLQVGATIQELSLADCGLSGNFPDEIFHLTNLTELDLSGNSMLLGQLPEFRKQSFLQSLYLSDTNLTGPLPYSIENLKYLSELDLSDNNFYGEIPCSITNLTRLEYLSLESNKLTGTIPISLFSHPSLKSFDLSKNQLSGYLPEFSNGSSLLEFINLDNNNFQGQLPISIFKSSQLGQLSVASNNFNGTLNLDVINNCKNLEFLDLSNNKLSIINGKNHNESFYASFPQVQYIMLASCNLIEFPTFLSYQTNIYHLDLSNSSLTGEIPLSICNGTLPNILELSYNNLTGTMPPCLLENDQLETLDLKSNKLSGPLSRNISQGCQLSRIILSGNRINGSLPQSLLNCNDLLVLDLGNNQIVDRFPFWLGNLKNLNVLVLRSNQFYGTISNMEARTKTNNSLFPTLMVLDLSSNRFRGIIPKFVFENLKSCPRIKRIYLNPGDYIFYDHPITLIWKGQEMEMKKTLRIFCLLDLSQNGFLGEIPEEIGQLESLDALNLSHNSLTGPIPSEFANLHQLQSLDLSFNQLAGNIPQVLTSLTFLSALDLSYNNLVGEIPQVPPFSAFPNASYLGNPGLCGIPLSV